MAALMPTLATSVAFSTNPTATPVWTVVSPYVRSLGIRRGRDFELDPMQAGTMSILLNNQDRRFDPYHASGPYFGNLVPRRRIRVQATWASTTHPVFSGYVEGWPQRWDQNGRVAEVSVTASDGFALLGQAALNATYGLELSSTRVDNVLTSVGWGSGQAAIVGSAIVGDSVTATVGPIGDRDVRTGTVTLASTTVANTSALAHLLAVAESEYGYAFISRAGDFTFIGRSYTASPIFATFGDSTGELKYSDLELGTAPIWNDVRLRAEGRTEQVASDSTSQAAYFLSSKVESGYLQAYDGDLQSLAGWWLYKYKQPQQRVISITISPGRDPDNLWPQALGREIGDHIIVKRRPPGGGVVISQESVIEGIEHQASPGQWSTRFSLSPADPVTAVALVGSAIVGTAVVAF